MERNASDTRLIGRNGFSTVDLRRKVTPRYTKPTKFLPKSGAKTGLASSKDLILKYNPFGQLTPRKGGESDASSDDTRSSVKGSPLFAKNLFLVRLVWKQHRHMKTRVSIRTRQLLPNQPDLLSILLLARQ